MRTLGVVLAGGASSRMGAPKWQLRLRDGQTLLARACEAMRNVCDDVVVLGAAPGMETAIDAEAVVDPPDTQGPLHALARYTPPEDVKRLLVLACDQPGVGEGELRLLLHANVETGRCAHFQEPGGGSHPMPACLGRDHWGRLVAQAQAGERRLSVAVTALNPLVLSVSHADVVRSLNTPEQWQAWRARHDPSDVATVRLMGEETEDHLSVEAPLQILLGPAPVAVVMRTPGHDQELVTGFLLNEGIVDAVSDIVDVQHCADVELPAARGHVVRARLRQGAEVDVAKLSRNTYVGSSCGICGQASIERAMAIRGGVSESWSPALEVMVAMPERLRARQRLFERTGGLHGVGLFDAEGRLWVVREDVGRHNAVDKVLGWLAHWRAHTPPLGLFVSGRVSFEIIQKALAADVAVVAGVSAPTSLAVDLAKEAGVSLWGFVRGGRANRYS